MTDLVVTTYGSQDTGTQSLRTTDTYTTNKAANRDI